MDRPGGDASYYSDDSDGWSTAATAAAAIAATANTAAATIANMAARPLAARGWIAAGCGGGQGHEWFFTADYLYVRAELQRGDRLHRRRRRRHLTITVNFVHELEFRARIVVPLRRRLSARLLRRRGPLHVHAAEQRCEHVAPQGSFVPYEVIGPDGPTFIDADVDVKSFDLDFRKTIPLGGACCECGDVL